MSNILTKDHIERLEKIHVSLVYLFGSYAEGKNHPLSDIDKIGRASCRERV